MIVSRSETKPDLEVIERPTTRFLFPVSCFIDKRVNRPSRRRGRREKQSRAAMDLRFRGSMGSRHGILLLFLLLLGCVHADSGNLGFMEINDHKVTTSSKLSNGSGRNGAICTLCEYFAARALSFLGNKKTQTIIINGLHQVCSILHPLKLQCLKFVDHHVLLFFHEVTQIQPEELCAKGHLCKIMISFRLPNRDDPCTICHNLVTEVLTKLTDPDVQMEIIEVLLKACSKVDNYAQECKKIVLHYGPLILFNIEKFLETTDICTVINVCEASQEAIGGGATLLADG